MDGQDTTTPTKKPITSIIEFDLTRLPAEERFEFWHDYGSRVYRPVRFRGDVDEGLAVRARLSQFGDVTLGHMSATSQTLERTARMIQRDHVDHFMLLAVEQGTLIVRGHCGEVRAEAGDIALIDTGKEGEITWSTHTQLFANLPRHTMHLPGSNWTPTPGLIKSDNAISSVVKQHLKTLWDLQHTETAAIRNELGLGLSRHISHYFRKPDEALTINDHEGYTTGLAHTIQNWIENNLHDPDLNADLLARTFHISRSALYELFTTSKGVRNYITERRLQRAMHILGSTNKEEPARIQAIAMELGFRNQATFSRAFHQRWGQTPREARKQRLGSITNTVTRNKETRSAEQAGAEKERLKDQLERYYTPILGNRPARMNGHQSSYSGS